MFTLSEQTGFVWVAEAQIAAKDENHPSFFDQNDGRPLHFYNRKHKN